MFGAEWFYQLEWLFSFLSSICSLLIKLALFLWKIFPKKDVGLGVNFLRGHFIRQNFLFFCHKEALPCFGLLFTQLGAAYLTFPGPVVWWRGPMWHTLRYLKWPFCGCILWLSGLSEILVKDPYSYSWLSPWNTFKSFRVCLSNLTYIIFIFPFFKKMFLLIYIFFSTSLWVWVF